ncbi:MAG TPA: hypothetical protein DEQ39_03750 [Atlantibacter hermannii]|nr:hypothetical protein [Atlantibacter hermannii]
MINSIFFNWFIIFLQRVYIMKIFVHTLIHRLILRVCAKIANCFPDPGLKGSYLFASYGIL